MKEREREIYMYAIERERERARERERKRDAICTGEALYRPKDAYTSVLHGH